MLTKFKLNGSRSFLRTDYEMSSVDKGEADRVFKSCKKQYLDPLLKAKGFLKYKTNAYVRRNQVDVLELIELQKERNGILACGKDVWWDYANDSIARNSFENVAKAIEEYVLPWFGACSNDDSIKELLLAKQEEQEGRLSVNERAWLESLDNHEDCSKTIERNIELFRLPKACCLK